MIISYYKVVIAFCTVGVIAGKFLERGRIRKPKLNPDDPSVYYQPEVKKDYKYNNLIACRIYILVLR